MAESMIERVARAIWKSTGGIAEKSPDDRVHERYLRMACAAIEAMREPTEEIVKKVASESFATGEEMYKFVIDSALNPEAK